MSDYEDSEYDYDEMPSTLSGGAKRRPSEWNKFVKANYGSVKHLPVKQRFAELAKMARAQGGVIGVSMRQRSACAQIDEDSSCQTDASCRWVTPTMYQTRSRVKGQKGKQLVARTRKGYCKTKTAPHAPTGPRGAQRPTAL